MRYNHNILIVCPESLADDLNHLSACLGLSMSDMAYFGEPNYTDGVNNYCVRNTVSTDALLVALQSELVRPGFDSEEQIDLARANSAKSKLIQSERGEEGMTVPPSAENIVFCVDLAPLSTIPLLGLTRIPTEA